MKQPFSWKVAKERAIQTKIRRAKTMAKAANNPDFTVRHPDWVRDAQAKNYTQLTKVITEDVKKIQGDALIRRLKRLGR